MSSANVPECTLNEVADYIVSKLNLAGVAAAAQKHRACQDEVAFEILVNTATGSTLTLWLIQYQSGTFKGLVEVLSYCDPFDPECLIAVGPSLIGKILRNCRAQVA